jgi:hypothetical protein
MRAGSILGLNSKEGVEQCDGESFKFHIPWKGTLRMVLNLVKIPEEWTKNLDQNSMILWEIFEDYKRCEGLTVAGGKLGANDAPAQQHRYDILSKVIPAGIIIPAHDSAYLEPRDRFLWMIIQNQHRFKFLPHRLDPDCWYHDAHDGEPAGRRMFGMIIPECQIVSADDHAIVVREVLPPKKYFASIEGIDHWVSIDSNRPVWAGTGWAYKVHAIYGTQEELQKKTLLGE